MKIILTALFIMLWGMPALATEPSITTLLEAVAKQPDIEASSFAVQGVDVRLKQAHAELFPKVSAFGSYTRFSSPTNLRPMAPTEVNIAGGESIPFSEDITRYGLKLEMPLFVKGLYTLADVAIGGLLIGTILTLIYIPIFAYSVEKKELSKYT